MRNSTRKRLLLAQYDRTDIIQGFRPLMNKYHTLLDRELRRSTLRKRLIKVNCDLDKAVKFDWQVFSSEFENALVSALNLVVKSVDEVEVEYWQARGKTIKLFVIGEIVAQYGARTNHWIHDIVNNVKELIYTYILEWYNSNRPFSDLMKVIAYYFSVDYIQSILQTEITYVISQICFNNMITFGVEGWDYEPFNFNIVECMNYSFYNPHSRIDPLPPICVGDKGLVIYRGING